MRRRPPFWLWILLAALLVPLLSPLRGKGSSLRSRLQGVLIRLPIISSGRSAASQEFSSELLALRQEVVRLTSELELLSAVATEEHQLEEWHRLAEQAEEAVPPSAEWKEVLRRRAEGLRTRLERRKAALQGKVVLREPAFWSSLLWIDLGESHNEKMGLRIVAEGSPVVLGDSVVGVIDLVQRNRCRVRLITDPSFAVAVRAARNSPAGAPFTQLFAKGILRGSSSLSCRTLTSLLRGEGFQYDVADQEGPARDLRDGAILQEGDLLVTSGLDGIFPEGLRVASVTKIDPLPPGGYSYRLEARAIVDPREELRYLTVLPPLCSSGVPLIGVLPSSLSK